MNTIDLRPLIDQVVFPILQAVLIPIVAGFAALALRRVASFFHVKVTQQASRLNVDAFVADLAAAGVKTALLRKLRKRHTTDFSGAHIITALLTG